MPLARFTRRAAIVLCAAAPIAAWSAPAFGKCAGPHALVSPQSGSTVPIDPTIYFFLPKYDKDRGKLRARSDGGGALVIDQSMVAQTESYIAYRLRVKASKPGAILIELPADSYYYGPKAWRYNVSADWHRPAPAKAEGALQLSSQSFRWTCSYQLSQNLKLPGHAAAYRLAIFDANSDGKGAPAQELVVPPRMMQFFEREGSPKSSDHDQIELGYINCFGNTFAWQAKPIQVDVFALQPDGSESRMTTAPMRVDPPVATDKGTKGIEH